MKRIKYIIAKIKHKIKVRFYAKRFNIFTEILDPKCKEGDWLSYDNKLYYGHPLFIFIESGHNVWWKKGRGASNVEIRKSQRPPSDDLQPGEYDYHTFSK